ncbi:hypothetical protein APHAL10511_004485 [Amanita phalloides]|nr:hypothetical protein APHAL10511_004485 [Amanita phalloides]
MQLQLLGRTHVLILSRWPSYDELSAWRLDELPDSRTYVGMKVIIPMIQFAATTRVRDCDATVVFLSNNEAVSIYSLSLHFLSDQPYMLCKSIPGPSEGRISVVEICNDITATVVARIPSNFGPPTYTAIFYNIPNKRKFFHEFSSHISLDRLQIKLYPKCFILTGVRNDALVVRIHELPPDLYVKDAFMDVTILSAEQCRLLAEYVLSPVSRLCEFYISTEPVYEHPSHFSLIVFHSFGEHTKGVADVYQVPINTTESGIQCHSYTRTHRFKTAIGTRPEIVCMGKTGYRAVWLDHEWESDEHRLWKATFRPGDPATVDPLVPPHHPLPFEAHMIASLSFEEATGRVCVGLRTGAVYILEF